MIGIYSENHTKSVNALCWQKEDLLIPKLGGLIELEVLQQ
jgi:hypothetical protein